MTFLERDKAKMVEKEYF
jgi:hypothetical protein